MPRRTRSSLAEDGGPPDHEDPSRDGGPEEPRDPLAQPDWPAEWVRLPAASGAYQMRSWDGPDSPDRGDRADPVEVIARSEEDHGPRVPRAARGGSGSAWSSDEETAEDGWTLRLRRRIARLTELADPGRRGLRTILVVLTSAAALTALVIWLQRPSTADLDVDGGRDVAAGPDGSASGTGSGDSIPADASPDTGSPDEAGAASDFSKPAGSASAENAAGTLVVAVVGRVAEPGVVELPEGSRVADAIQRAGGPLPDADLTSVNLAARLDDGQQLVVAPLGPDGQPNPVSGGFSGTVGGGGPERSDGPLNLNTATQEELDSLPGVGPVLAERIASWREDNGGFASVEQLREVQGIGEVRFSDLRERVTV